MLLASIGTSALVMFNLIPAETADILSNFNNTMGFLDLYILTLITGRDSVHRQKAADPRLRRIYSRDSGRRCDVRAGLPPLRRF